LNTIINNPGSNLLENKNLTTALKWWNYVRWFSTISFLSVGIIQMAIKKQEFPQYTFIYTLIGIMILNMAYSYWLDNFKMNGLYILFHNFLDISIFSMVIYMTDGPESPLIWLYLIPILTSSITVGRGAGLWASLLSLISLFVMLFLSEYHTIHLNMELLWIIIAFAEKNTITLISYACLFFLAYFISSFLATTLRLQNNELIRLNASMYKKNNAIVESCNKKIFKEKQIFVDTILRTLQHELNNPLTILSVNADLLVKEEGRTYIERVESIQNNIARIRSIMLKIENRYRNEEHNTIDPLEIIDYQKSREMQERWFSDYQTNNI
jgi:signal transduction histidine kinase